MKNLHKESETGYAALTLLTAISKIGKRNNRDMEELPDSSEEQKNFVLEIIYKKLKINFMKKCAKKISVMATFAIFIIFSIFNILVFSVSALRDPVIDFLMGLNGDYGTVQGHDGFYIDDSETKAPQYIPKGFTINQYSRADGITSIEYTNSQNDTILFTQNDGNSSALLDTEDTQGQEEILLERDRVGLWIEKESKNQLIWEIESHTFILQSNLPKDKLIQIANSVLIN